MPRARLSHVGVQGLKLARDRAAMEGRSPVLFVIGTMDEDSLKEADRLEVSVADRPRLLLLLKKYQLTGGLLKEIDRKILEKEGSRFLPSIGRFDARMQAAEDALKQGRYSGCAGGAEPGARDEAGARPGLEDEGAGASRAQGRTRGRSRRVSRRSTSATGTRGRGTCSA